MKFSELSRRVRDAETEIAFNANGREIEIESELKWTKPFKIDSLSDSLAELESDLRMPIRDSIETSIKEPIRIDVPGRSDIVPDFEM